MFSHESMEEQYWLLYLLAYYKHTISILFFVILFYTEWMS